MEDFYATKAYALLKSVEEWNANAEELSEMLGFKSFNAESAENARKIAMPYERVLVDLLAGDLFHPVKTVLKNPLSPKNEIEVKKVDRTGEVKNLINRIKRLDDARLKYHLLYALYELAAQPAIPADPRVPTHTIFDYAYASASTVNWTYRNSGYLVMVDLAGVQGFISASRKLRDLWVSSWLVSALCWAIVRKFVEILGPDVLISPSARRNPFYFHSLLVMLKNYDFDIADVAYFYGYDEDMGAPEHAVVPATAVLILPGDDVLKKLISEFNDISEVLISEYREAWKRFVESMRNFKEALCKIEDEEDEKKAEELSEMIERAFKEAEKMGIVDVPPLQLRVAKVSVNLSRADGVNLVYDKTYRDLVDSLALTKTLKSSTAYASDLTKWSEEMYKKELWRHCTICGLPAVLKIPKEREEEERKGEEKYYEDVVPPELRPVFGPGERLCFYCLLKRLCSLGKLFEKVVEVLIGKHGEVKERTFPSVSDVALVPFRLRLLDYARKLAEAGEIYELKELISKLQKIFAKVVKKPKVKPPESTGFKELDEKIEAVKKTLLQVISDEEFTSLKWALCADAEPMFFSDDVEIRKLVRELLKEIEKTGDSEFTTYYSILRADADSIGKLLSGNLKEAIGTKPEDLLVDYVAEELKEIVKDFLKLNEEGMNDLVKKMQKMTGRNEEEIKKRVEKAHDLLKSMPDGKIILSPVFHAMISRALMVQAMKDAREIEINNGFLVYSGGDDLLAVIPVKNSLNACKNTRICFGAGDRQGFYEFGIPAMGFVGRSCSLIYGHYMHPLSSLLSLSAEFLEDYAKKARWSNDSVLEKDTCLVAYIPRGSRNARISFLPLKEKRIERVEKGKFAKSLQIVNSLSEGVVEERVSRSLLYRLLEDESIWELAKKDICKSKKLIEFLVKKTGINPEEMQLKEIVERLKFKVLLEDELKDEKRRKRKTDKIEAINLSSEIIKACLNKISAERSRW